MGAEQVVEGVPAGAVFGDEVQAGEFGQQRPGPAQGQSGEGGGGKQGEVGAGVQGEQPEQAGGLVGDLTGGPGEDGADVHGGVRAGERVEAAVGLAQLGGDGGEREVGVGGGAGGDAGECEGESGAQAGDLVGGARFGVDACGAQASDEEVARLRGVEGTQRQRVGAVRGDQPGQGVAAGDDGEAAGRAGQQRPYMVAVAGVVQDDEDPPPGQHTAVEGGLGVHAVRYPVGGTPRASRKPRTASPASMTAPQGS